MLSVVRSSARSGKQLEAWLEEALVPVEPSSRFTRSLRARLVSYRGDRFASIWMVLAVLGTSILLLVAISSFALRLAMAILGGVELLSRQKRQRDRIRLRPT
jgi:hypothetical protein